MSDPSVCARPPGTPPLEPGDIDLPPCCELRQLTRWRRAIGSHFLIRCRFFTRQARSVYLSTNQNEGTRDPPAESSAQTTVSSARSSDPRIVTTLPSPSF